MQIYTKSVEQVYSALNGWGITELLKMSDTQTLALSNTLIRIIIGFCILSIFVMIGRAVGFFKAVHTKGNRVIATFAILMGALMIFDLIYGDGTQYIWNYYIQIFTGLRYLPQFSIFQIAVILIGVLIVIVLSFFCLVMIWLCIRHLPILIIDNIAANGILRGLILSVYDLGSGLFWLILVVCAVSGAIAIVLFPFIIALCSLGQDRRYIIVYRD